MASTSTPSRARARPAGHLVVESLAALGARRAFGVPGQHALAIYDGLGGGELEFVGLRTEVAAGYAAHGHASVTGTPTPLLVSTGPGALSALAGLQEAETSGVPVVCISSEIPREGLGRNRGFVHELRDQIAHFRPVVKRALHVGAAEAIPESLAEAWRLAATPPSGPVFVQIPTDVLAAPTGAAAVSELDGRPDARPPRPQAIAAAAEALCGAESVTILAGGGVLRAAAWRQLAELAERLGAPVVTSFGGKGAFAPEHPLSAGSACEDQNVMRLIGDADVALVVGASLSEETCNHYALEPGGTLIQIEADASRVGTTYSATAIVADARLALESLLAQLEGVEPASDGPARARRTRELVDARFEREGRQQERGILRAIESVCDERTITSWDMTIMAYWAALDFAVRRPRSYLYPQGSGALGYGYPAALGAQAADRQAPVLAIAGDGGIMYGLSEAAAARQAGLDAKLLIIDDGGYGVLREYQRAAYGRTFATELVRPDFVAVLGGFGVPARTADVDGLQTALAWALEQAGPAAVVLEAEPVMFAPTHLS